MTEVTDAQKASKEYRLGYAAGKAENRPNKWGAFVSVGGLFIILLIVAVICGVPQKLYGMYKDQQIQQEKIQACASAPNVAECIRAVDAD